MASLRELFISLTVKSDKSELVATDQAISKTEARAGRLESRINEAAAGFGALRTAAQSALGTVERLVRVGTRPQLPALPIPALALPENAGQTRRSVIPPKLSGERRATEPAPPPSPTVPNTNALGAAREKLGGFAQSVMAARAGVLGLVAAVAGNFVSHFVGDVIKLGDSLDDASHRTRISVESLQVWRKLASMAGADASTVESSFRKLSRSMAAAGRDSKLQADAFKQLGVPVKNANGSLRSAEDVMIDVGSALAQMDDDAKATAMATQLMGPAGAAMVPIFEEGADAIRKQTKALKENVAISSEEAAAMGKLDDSMNAAAGAWKAIKARIVVAFLPLVTILINGWEKVSKAIRDVVKTSQIINTAFAALAFGGLRTAVGAALSFVKTAGGWRTVLSMMGSGLRTVAGAAFRFIAPLLVIEDILTFLAGGKSVTGRLFDEILGDGGAVAARQQLLDWFGQLQAAVGELKPALEAIGAAFKDVAAVSFEGLIGFLNLIGIALTDNHNKIDELGNRFLGTAQKIEDAIDSVLAKLGLASDKTKVSFTPTDQGPSLLQRAGTAIGLGDFFGAVDSNANRKAKAEAAARPDFELSPVVIGARPRTYQPPTTPVPAVAATPGSTNNVSTKNVTLTDQRQINVSVGGTSSPGATGRETGRAVSSALEIDRKQTLIAVGG